MTKKTRNVLLVLLLIYTVPVFVIGGIIAWLALRPLPPLTPLPNPNAYDDLVKAGRMVSANTKNYMKLKGDALRTLAATNAAALARARDVLENPCRVPLDYTMGGWQKKPDSHARLRSLSQAFAADARLAKQDQRWARAAGDDLDLLQLAADTGRGGMMVDAFAAISVGSLGADDLAGLISHLDATTCRDDAGTLEMLDAELPSWAQVTKAEDDWVRRTFGWRTVLVELMLHQQLKRNGQKAEKYYEREQFKRLRLEINLAARAYTLDKGHPPAHNADLVPEYLKAVPKSPTTGKPLE